MQKKYRTYNDLKESGDLEGIATLYSALKFGGITDNEGNAIKINNFREELRSQLNISDYMLTRVLNESKENLRQYEDGNVFADALTGRSRKHVVTTFSEEQKYTNCELDLESTANIAKTDYVESPEILSPKKNEVIIPANRPWYSRAFKSVKSAAVKGVASLLIASYILMPLVPKNALSSPVSLLGEKDTHYEIQSQDYFENRINELEKILNVKPSIFSKKNDGRTSDQIIKDLEKELGVYNSQRETLAKMTREQQIRWYEEKLGISEKKRDSRTSDQIIEDLEKDLNVDASYGGALKSMTPDQVIAYYEKELDIKEGISAKKKNIKEKTYTALNKTPVLENDYIHVSSNISERVYKVKKGDGLLKIVNKFWGNKITEKSGAKEGTNLYERIKIRLNNLVAKSNGVDKDTNGDNILGDNIFVGQEIQLGDDSIVDLAISNEGIDYGNETVVASVEPSEDKKGSKHIVKKGQFLLGIVDKLLGKKIEEKVHSKKGTKLYEKARIKINNEIAKRNGLTKDRNNDGILGDEIEAGQELDISYDNLGGIEEDIREVAA